MTASHVPDLAGLRLLVAVSRTGSIGAAARSVGVSQQSASERLRNLEAQTGVTLVHRGARGSVLTDSGVVVTEWAARLIDLTDEVETAIMGLRSSSTTELAVWASMTIADGLIPRWLVTLRHQQTRAGLTPTRVSLTAANSHRVIDAVRADEARVGFVEGRGTPAHLRSLVIAQDELVLIDAAGSALGRRRRPLTAAEVADLPLITREPGSGTQDVLEAALAAEGQTLTAPGLELTTTTAVRGSVLAGSGPAFLSRRIVEDDLASGNLVVVRTTLDLQRSFRAVWSGGGQQPPAGPARDLVAIARRTTRPQRQE